MSGLNLRTKRAKNQDPTFLGFNRQLPGLRFPPDRITAEDQNPEPAGSGESEIRH